MALVNAIVLINIERTQIEAVAQKLLTLDGVAEVFSVAGRYDLVAVLRCKTNEQVADLVTQHILDIPHITHTETLMAFKAYSRDDLGAMFSVGNEEVLNP